MAAPYAFRTYAADGAKTLLLATASVWKDTAWNRAGSGWCFRNRARDAYVTSSSGGSKARAPSPSGARKRTSSALPVIFRSDAVDVKSEAIGDPPYGVCTVITPETTSLSLCSCSANAAHASTPPLEWPIRTTRVWFPATSPPSSSAKSRISEHSASAFAAVVPAPRAARESRAVAPRLRKCSTASHW